jgi:ABC-type glycerol-3-phosphate transport system substrate-binding protein
VGAVVEGSGLPGGGRRWTRRSALRLGAAGALASAWGMAVTGCSRAATPTTPTPTNPTTVIVWAPWRVGWGNGWDHVFYAATEPFRTAHPGVDIRIDIGGSNGSNDGGLIPLIIAGTAPDVYSGYGPTKMIEGGYNLNLQSYLETQNVDTSIFDQGEYVKFVRSDGIWALPAELSTSAVAVNLAMLDQLGVAYPDKQWDYNAAAQLWKAVAAPASGSTKKRVGFVYWGQKAAYLAGDFYLRGWGASAAAANFSPKSGLDSPQALAFAQWWYPLVADGVIAWNGAAPPWPQQVACGFAGSWTLPQFATRNDIKWDFWPQPAWPTGTSAYAGNDYYAVSATTRHPEEAAAFITWLTTDVTWQRTLMQLQLVVPPNSKLWSEWETVVQTVAPPLKGKNLGAFTEAALQNRAFNHPAFAYSSDHAYSIVSPFTSQMATGKLDPVAGFTQAADAVNRFEAGQAVVATSAGSMSKLFPTTGPEVAPVPAGI